MKISGKKYFFPYLQNIYSNLQLFQLHIHVLILWCVECSASGQICARFVLFTNRLHHTRVVFRACVF